VALAWEGVEPPRQRCAHAPLTTQAPCPAPVKSYLITSFSTFWCAKKQNIYLEKPTINFYKTAFQLVTGQLFKKLKISNLNKQGLRLLPCVFLSFQCHLKLVYHEVCGLAVSWTPLHDVAVFTYRELISTQFTLCFDYWYFQHLHPLFYMVTFLFLNCFVQCSCQLVPRCTESNDSNLNG
jgi:hypothetical protein